MLLFFLYICPDRWLNVNYAEVEFIDKLLGSHHTQSEKIAQYQKTKQQWEKSAEA